MLEESTDGRQLERIQRAYDLTVNLYSKGIDPLDEIPETLKRSPDLRAFVEDTKRSCNSGDPDNRYYLDPQAGMRFLDAGCGANLANYQLNKWQFIYYGVDISPETIKAMKNFVARKRISIGGLWVADLSELPFEDNFFDIAAVIGVMEYYTLEYIKAALLELNRVLKPHAKAVLDIPNREHPHFPIMLELEDYMRRPNIPHSRSKFEEILRPLFRIESVDSSRVMLKYFVRAIKSDKMEADNLHERQQSSASILKNLRKALFGDPSKNWHR